MSFQMIKAPCSLCCRCVVTSTLSDYPICRTCYDDIDDGWPPEDGAGGGISDQCFECGRYAEAGECFHPTLVEIAPDYPTGDLTPISLCSACAAEQE